MPDTALRRKKRARMCLHEALGYNHGSLKSSSREMKAEEPELRVILHCRGSQGRPCFKKERTGRKKNLERKEGGAEGS